MNRKISGYILIFVFCLLTSTAIAAGLSTNWGEIVINGLETGKEYNLNALTASFTIKNNFDGQAILKIEVLQPKPEELKPGYEALPDISWVKLDKSEIEIAAGKEKIINIRLAIPKDEKHKGKKYQFWVWSYTTGKAVGVGLKSRILIIVK